MSSDLQAAEHRAVLVLPQIRVQNANAISSPMTWGFPAITAFTGLMTALERRLGADAGIAFHGVGVICHSFEAQVTTTGYTRAFHLTRNPVLHDGSTAGIVEEGRVHLEVTLVFDARLRSAQRGDAERAALAARVADTLAGMRLAGGSVVPPLPSASRHAKAALLSLVPDGWQAEASDEQARLHRVWFRRLARRWVPGFALVSRDDLLQAQWDSLRAANPQASLLDAWLDLARWTARAVAAAPEDGSGAEAKVEWVTARRPGWIVPIPVGFASLSGLQPAGTVAGARDSTLPFRFVETVWSVGQWIGPHRLKALDELTWAPDHDHDYQQPDAQTLYRCVNRFQPAAPRAEPAPLHQD